MGSARSGTTTLLLLMMLPGCLGRSAQPSFYTLHPVVSAEAGEASGPALGVGPARLPSYLERPHIVTRRGNELSYDDMQRWGGSLESEFLQALGANLARMLGSDRVAIYPSEPGYALDFRLALDVERFDGAPGEAVTLEVRWVLTAGVGGETLGTGSANIRTPVASRQYRDLVAAHSAAIGSLSREIAARIRALEP